MEYFGREWAVMVDTPRGGRLFEGAHIQARARWPRSGDGQPTTELTVSQPPPEMYALAVDPDAVWSVLAGYEQGARRSVIGSGKPVPSSVRPRRSGAAITLSMTLQGSRRAQEVVVSESWLDATTARSVLASLASGRGLALDLHPAVGDVAYPTGYTVSATLAEVLGDLARDLGCRLILDGNAVRMWPRDVPRRALAMVWSAETGLLERPMLTGSPGSPREVEVVGRLVPGMRPGDHLQVESSWSGALTLLEVEHVAVAPAGAWRTLAVGRPA